MSSFDDVLASIQRLLVSEKVITERSGDKLKKALESDAGKGLLAEAAAAAATAAAEASNEPPLSQRRSTRKTGPCPAPDVPSPQQPEMISFSSLEDCEVIMKEGKNIVKCKVKNPAKNLNALKNLINLKNQQVVAVLSGKDKKGKSSSGKGKGRSSKKSSEQPSEEERGTEEDDEEIDMELDDDCEERLNASYNTQEEKDAATWLRLMNKITGDHSEPHGDAVRALSCAVDFATSARVKSKHQTLPSGVPVSRLDRQLRLCEVGWPACCLDCFVAVVEGCALGTLVCISTSEGKTTYDEPLTCWVTVLNLFGVICRSCIVSQRTLWDHFTRSKNR